jgi:hypothetical protein
MAAAYTPPPPLSAQQVAHELHFIARAQERYGLKVKPGYYRHLCEKVRSLARGTRPISVQPPHRSVWLIRAGGAPMRVVFDASTDRLVTCLPPAVEHVPVKRFRRQQRRAFNRRRRGLYRDSHG